MVYFQGNLQRNSNITKQNLKLYTVNINKHARNKKTLECRQPRFQEKSGECNYLDYCKCVFDFHFYNLKTHEKHPWRNATLLKVGLLHGFFFMFFNFYKWYHMAQIISFDPLNPFHATGLFLYLHENRKYMVI